MQNECINGLHCVNWYYKDNQKALNHYSTGYGCANDWAICEDDAEQKTIVMSESEIDVQFSWTCELREMNLEVATDVSFIEQIEIINGASQLLTALSSFAIIAVMN